MNNEIMFLRNDFMESTNYTYSKDIMEIFLLNLKNLIEENTNMKVVIRDVEKQLKDVPKFEFKTISLDKYYNGDYNLNVSRHFRINDKNQYHSYKIDTSDINFPLKEQIKKIDSGKYILVDDDCVSGDTVKYFISLLNKYNKNIEIVGTYFLTKNKYKDVLDVRDFIFGSKNGGLLFSNNYIQFRLPYINEYVNLKTRASFITDGVDFSLKIKEMNKNLLGRYI